MNKKKIKPHAKDLNFFVRIFRKNKNKFIVSEESSVRKNNFSNKNSIKSSRKLKIVSSTNLMDFNQSNSNNNFINSNIHHNNSLLSKKASSLNMAHLRGNSANLSSIPEKQVNETNGPVKFEKKVSFLPINSTIENDNKLDITKHKPHICTRNGNEPTNHNNKQNHSQNENNNPEQNNNSNCLINCLSIQRKLSMIDISNIPFKNKSLLETKKIIEQKSFIFKFSNAFKDRELEKHEEIVKKQMNFFHSIFNF